MQTCRCQKRGSCNRAADGGERTLTAHSPAPELHDAQCTDGSATKASMQREHHNCHYELAHFGEHHVSVDSAGRLAVAVFVQPRFGEKRNLETFLCMGVS